MAAALAGGTGAGFAEARGLGSKILVLALACGAAIVVARSRWRNALPFLPLALLPLPAMTLARVGPVSLAWLLPVLVVLAAAWVIITSRVRPQPDLVMLIALLLLIAQVTLAPFTGGAGNSTAAVQAAIVWLAGFTIGSAFGGDDRQAVLLAQVAVPLGALAIVEQFAFRFTYSRAITATNYLDLGTSGGDVRAISTFGHPLVAGACLVTLGVLALSTRAQSRWLVAAVLLGGALSTVSRSGILGGIAGVLALLVTVGQRARRRLLRAAAVLVGVVLLVLAISGQVRHTFDDRILGASSQGQQIRQNSLAVVESDFNSNASALLFGGGLGAAEHRLAALGGNLGFPVFDNQYVTGIYEFGLVPLLLLLVSMVWAIARAPSGARRLGLPALITIAVTFGFFDGFGWPVAGFLLWYLVGLTTSRSGEAADSGPGVAVAGRFELARAAVGRGRP